MEWGKEIELLEYRARKGLRTPALENRPTVRYDLLRVWEAFWELASYRQCGMTANPISITEIATWLDENSIRGQRRRWFIELIHAMDIACLTRKTRKEKRGKDE